MSRTLTQIANQLRTNESKVQLIYAFNASGKTRLSRIFKNLIDQNQSSEIENKEGRYANILYYSAFTEDLFYWDNDLDNDSEPKLMIQRNRYTQWALEEQGLEQSVIGIFQRYTSKNIIPHFSGNYLEVSFSYQKEDGELVDNVKISKSEESIFIWSIFFNILEQVVAMLNEADDDERRNSRYGQLEYVFIDDPVTSLDENHLIMLAVELAKLIELVYFEKTDLRFIVTTHNPLFYNVIYNELDLKKGYILSKLDVGSFDLEIRKGAANRVFSYHLHIKNLIENAIKQDDVQRFHFNLLRNLYEKTAAFLGYRRWSDLLSKDLETKKEYLVRIMNFSSHSDLSNEEISMPTESDKQDAKLLIDNLNNNFGPWYKEQKEEKITSD